MVIHYANVLYMITLAILSALSLISIAFSPSNNSSTVVVNTITQYQNVLVSSDICCVNLYGLAWDFRCNFGIKKNVFPKIVHSRQMVSQFTLAISVNRKPITASVLILS